MFPLPLTCLEEYMLYDDRPSHPMTGVVRLRFSGRLDRRAFEAAFASVVERHALMRATIGRAGGRRLDWIDHPEWRPEVVWQAPTNPYGYPDMGHIDLTQQPGSRVWIVDRDGGQDAVIQVHHACADGLGLSRMAEDLLMSYTQQVTAGQLHGSLPELDLASFRRRGAPGLTAGEFLWKAHRQAMGLHGVWEFLTRSPVPIGPPAGAFDPAVPPPAFPCPQRHVLDAEETRRLLAAAKSRGVTLNDLLLRDLFLTVTQWRQRRGFGSPREWLRFSVPMNLRRASDAGMPMANSVSSVFLDRRAVDCADSDQLLRGIRRQMQRIKRCQLQYTFVLSLGLFRHLPGGLASRVQSTKCELSSYFSNLGPVLDRLPLPKRDGCLVCGDVELSGVDFVIPLRPFVNASFCVYTYGGKLNILMHPDVRALPDETSATLLKEFVQRLRDTGE